jgi:DNA damage-binding protein 1
MSLQKTRPHLLVLLSPPNAHLLLITYNPSSTPSLIVTASLPLNPPTPSLRPAEFFNSVVAQGNTAIVSLWTGVLMCIEIDVEKDKDVKKRRASEIVKTEEEPKTKTLIFRDNFNIK